MQVNSILKTFEFFQLVTKSPFKMFEIKKQKMIAKPFQAASKIWNNFLK